MRKWLALAVALPLLDLGLLVVLGRWLGVWGTLALVLGSALLGGWLAKREGLRVLRAWRDAVASGRVPEEGVLDGALVVAGGLSLVTPGVVTDLLGALLLIRPARRWIAARIRERLERRFRSPVGRGDARAEVVDGPGFVSYRVSVVDVVGSPFESREPRVGHDPLAMPRASDPDIIDVEGELVETERGGVVPPSRRLPE